MAFREKDWKKCFTDLKICLRELGNQVPPIVRVGLGVCAFRLRQFAHAKQCFDRALEVNPDEPTALLGLFALVAHQRDIAKASDVIRRLAELWPAAVASQKLTDVMFFKAVAAGKVKAQSKMLLQRIDEADAMARESGHKELAAYGEMQRGRVLQCLGKHGEARELFKSALAAVPTLHAARLHYAETIMKSGGDGADDLALAELDQVRRAHPQNARAVAMAAVLKSNCKAHGTAIQLAKLLTDSVSVGDPSAWSVSAWSHRTDAATYTKHVQEQRKLADEHGLPRNEFYDCNIAALAKDTDTMIATAKKKFGVDLGGSEWMKKSVDPEVVPLAFNYAMAREQFRTPEDVKAARQTYTTLVKHFPAMPEPYFRLMHIAVHENNNPTEAVAWAEAMLRVTDNDAGFVSIASVLARTSLKAAHRCVQEAEKRFPESTTATLAKAALYLQEHAQRTKTAHMKPLTEEQKQQQAAKLRQAAALYDRVLAKEPSNVQAAHGVACCTAELGNFMHALPLLDRVVEVNVNDEAARDGAKDHLFNALVKTGAWRQAIDAAAKDTDAQKWQRTLALARCHSQLSEFQQSLELLKECYENSPHKGNFEVGYHYAVTLIASVFHVLSTSVEASDAAVDELKQRLEKARKLASKDGKQLAQCGELAKQKYEHLKRLVKDADSPELQRGLDALRKNAVLNAKQQQRLRPQWADQAVSFRIRAEAAAQEEETAKRLAKEARLARAEGSFRKTQDLAQGIFSVSQFAAADNAGGGGGEHFEAGEAYEGSEAGSKRPRDDGLGEEGLDYGVAAAESADPFLADADGLLAQLDAEDEAVAVADGTAVAVADDNAVAADAPPLPETLLVGQPTTLLDEEE